MEPGNTLLKGNGAILENTSEFVARDHRRLGERLNSRCANIGLQATARSFFVSGLRWRRLGLWRRNNQGGSMLAWRFATCRQAGSNGRDGRGQPNRLLAPIQH